MFVLFFNGTKFVAITLLFLQYLQSIIIIIIIIIIT